MIEQIVYDVENYLDISFKNPKFISDLSNLGEENINEHYDSIIVHNDILEIVKNNHKGIVGKGKIYFRKSVDYPRYMLKEFSDLTSTKKLDKCDYIVDNIGIQRGYQMFLRVGEKEYIYFDK